jgi:ribonucleoside-diphosphate reductase alpha chain
MDVQVTPSNEGQASVIPTKSSLSFDLYFSKHGHPFDSVKWTKRDASIKNAKGEAVFEQKDVEAPESWSDRAVNIVAEKYFRVVNGVKENSVKQLVTRVAHTIAKAGYEQFLLSLETSLVFEQELTYMLLHQMFAFNSPVWFNIGVPGVSQQASACFINGVEDTMESITELGRTEIKLFKGGSGAGSNLSKIRSSYETLSGGGTPSGPVSFMRWLDSGAGVTKSGGTTRRAAKMVVLNADHPDILVQANGQPGFIHCKTEAEKIAQALIAAGFSAEFNQPGNAYDLSPFQNANNSVRVTDFFMRKVIDDQAFQTKSRTTNETVHTYKARELWDEIAKATWASGDPGIQFDTTTNKWHTLPNTGRINSSNPCSEFLHLDDTSCNLGSFNLLKFIKGPGSEFDAVAFSKATEVCIVAMEILCGMADYPTPQITKHTKASRPLGIGYANLGSLLMVKGLAYDSPEGREFAAGLTSLMTATGYKMSAIMAQSVGAFDYYADNKQAMLNVIEMHKEASEKLPQRHHTTIRMANEEWSAALAAGKQNGYRNSQISVLAPTGTIGFMMDCDTTGIEPMLALVQHKKLVGGGYVKMPNRIAVDAARNLGYVNSDLEMLMADLEGTHSPPIFSPAHRKVFQTAIGSDQISTDGHLLMMAAVQPFLSGGISKTVNMPNSATVGDVANAYMRSWELGLKCVAIYRDGCKASQPVSAKTSKKEEAKTLDAEQSEELKSALKKTIKEFEEGKSHLRWGERKRLSDERMSVTHKFSIAGQDGYIHAGLNDDGTPGEVFLSISKAGSTLHGLVDMAATAISVGLQYGVPLGTLLEKFRGVRFEPSGFTGNKEIPRADSIADYLAKWMEIRFLLPQAPKESSSAPTPVLPPSSMHGDPCRSCGNLTVRAGSCWVCVSCGSTTGCG